MAYRLDPSRSPAKAIERVLQQQITRATRAVRDSAQPVAERARRARVACKKIRAVLHLVHAHDPKALKRQERRFRDAARQLSALRDQGAALSTLEDLRKNSPDGIERPCFDRATRALARTPRTDGVSPVKGTAALREFARTMNRARTRLEKFGQLDGDAGDLTEGFRVAYAQARRSFRSAREHPDAETLHVWRKRTKTHLYHCTLLANAWPEMMKPWQTALKRLAALLGQERDLMLLRERLVKTTPLKREGDRAVRPLLKVIDRRRATLRREAFSMGERLFAEKPKTVAHRVEYWWTAGPLQTEAVAKRG